MDRMNPTMSIINPTEPHAIQGEIKIDKYLTIDMHRNRMPITAKLAPIIAIIIFLMIELAISDIYGLTTSRM